MLVEIILSVVGEAALAYASDKGFELFKSKEAKKEVAEIGCAAIEAGIQSAPSLAADLRSISFVKGVFVPVLETVISDPSDLPDPNGLAKQFVETFVQRFVKDDTTDEVLRRIFLTDPKDLVAAFEIIIRELRSQFNRSKYWREVGHFIAVETTLANTAAIRAILERQQREGEEAAIDFNAAIRDAKAGSDELREWPRDIAGREILRPELERLKKHIQEAPYGTSILIGEAGSGKSALMGTLTDELESCGHVVFGIKADTLPATIQSIEDVGIALGMAGPLATEIAVVARSAPVTVIIDQLDAVSDVMDRSSDRMKVLLRMVKNIRDQALPVHVVVSSRPFEAAHDARFQQLKAEEFSLALPSIDDVVALLSELQVECAGISDELKETLRRPFALKLFVQLVQRGVDPASVEAGDLLDRWLATADLGPDDTRRSVLKLMQSLASEMLETETLWRPADVYEAGSKGALARGEACGLIVRSGQKIGFSHQSWLDDFQAKGFRTGKDLADYAWQNQDSLFVRATVLRSLQRLRTTDEGAYVRAVFALLSDGKTRRHLRHLVTDAISTVRSPTAQEAAWVDTLIRTDPILANRALGRVVQNWPNWRPFLSKCLPELMAKTQYHWPAVQALAEEAKIDPDGVVSLVRSHWSDPERDELVFRIVEQSGVITERVEELIGVLLRRTAIDPHSVSHLVTMLRTDGRFLEACRVVAIWVQTVDVGRDKNPQLYDVERLAEAAPLEFAETLMPWFLEQAAKDVEPNRDGIKRYSKSQSLPWDWDFERERGSIIEAFRDAMNAVAKADAASSTRLIGMMGSVEIDQVQEVIAQNYIAAGAALACHALRYVLADERRFYLGETHVMVEPGLSSIEAGLTSQELVEAIGAHLPTDRLADLRDAIETWSLYGAAYGTEDDAELKRMRLRWSDEHRMELLERLPPAILAPRRQRQIKEWRAAKGRPIPRKRGTTMATWVGSPMPASTMERAADHDIFGMLDAIHDTSPEYPRRRPISRNGGVSELSRAFGEFGKNNPERAVRVAQRFVAGKHENAAGYLMDELSKDGIYPPREVLRLIHEFSAKGFASRTWTTHAAWALSRLSGELKGLPTETLTMLESWLENDPETIADQVQKRLVSEAENERRNKKERAMPSPFLFRAYGGMRMVPQENYTLLAAIFHGLLGRDEPAYEAWLDVLERHASKPEDPHIWSFLLADKGKWLFWADRSRVQALLSKLSDLDFRIFMSIDLVGLLWSARAMFPDQLIVRVCEAWFASEDDEFRQAAAELAEAFAIVEPDSVTAKALAALVNDDVSPELTGRLFTAASAWGENERSLKAQAHAFLMEHVSRVGGDQAHAISAAVDQTDNLAPDDFTRELIVAVADNASVLAASLTGRFADGLQSLLLYPGFDEPVMYVTERIATLIVDQRGGMHRGFIDRDFVQVAIALQRNDAPLRARAMDVYEKLLDAGAYGAEEAAKAAMGR
ncbi:ATP-binding protein [Croceibacterium sp. LX-88]|uniref:ATP-binding protein n=1 Tax=Croceibacterium selenioxidans TaxID=2838833 RepID=A0ABS5VYU9_9SPHN|nr:ATP-binding protein [Croceibacterium selenioxidans]MBT2132701.1 ATP-binding protein [Croceibacterium selenioxidans]